MQAQGAQHLAQQGMHLAMAGRFAEAEALFRQYVKRHPRDPRGHYNLGRVLRDLHQDLAALEALRRAVRLDGDFFAAQATLANTLSDLNDPQTALIHYRKALALNPKAYGVAAHVAHLQAQACDWDAMAKTQAIVFDGIAQGAPLAPFQILAMPSTAQQQLQAARAWSKQFSFAPLWRPEAAPAPGERLRVGYLSSDLHDHATAHLITEVIERHNRARFAVSAYSFGPDDGSALRRRLEQAFETFIDLAAAPDAEAATRIAADRPHILVDLKGYTRQSRNGVMARRPGAIQVNFLGYPGTCGSAFHDVIIADGELIEPTDHGDYSERPVLMPHSYQPNDRLRAVADPGPSRAECGLPDGALVLCCFNNAFKIKPDVFAQWMEILRTVPDAVLWLLGGESERALRREAKAAGIDARRLIFAPRVPADRHVARYAHADLFLDTFPYNAHTTASEALWMGVPVLTRRGDTFASRVAASLVRAVHLPRLITRTPQDYTAQAIALAQDRPRLAALKHDLLTHRHSLPLFDAEAYVRALEAHYLELPALFPDRWISP